MTHSIIISDTNKGASSFIFVFITYIGFKNRVDSTITSPATLEWLHPGLDGCRTPINIQHKKRRKTKKERRKLLQWDQHCNGYNHETCDTWHKSKSLLFLLNIWHSCTPECSWEIRKMRLIRKVSWLCYFKNPTYLIVSLWRKRTLGLIMESGQITIFKV